MEEERWRSREREMEVEEEKQKMDDRKREENCGGQQEHLLPTQ